MADSPASGGRAAWRPDGATRSRARLTRFLADTGRTSWESLYRYSIDDVEGFTADVLRFLDIRFDKAPDRILDVTRGPEWPVWCPGGRLNISRSCLDKHLEAGAGGRPALIWEGEEGPGSVRAFTYAELADAVGRCAAGLRACGLAQGDAVGLHLPMLPETAIALLALARIGAVAVPLFSGYGPAALAARLQDVEAKAVFACDGFPRRGKNVPAGAALEEAAADCPALRLVIEVPRLAGLSGRGGVGQGPEEPAPPRLEHLAWEELLALGSAPGGDASPAPTAAEDPLIVLYTSGTTGKPKGILHTHCGFPVKAAQDMAFGTDAGPGDRITWVTDIGWMMGPWLIYGAAILGATMVLYDGAPDFPAPDRLWEVCARHRVGILGISPSLIRSLMHRGDDLPARHDLSSLRILASTGEPWNPEPWEWLFEKVGGSRLPIINYSGGTEISGGILMGNPLLPVSPCAFAAPCPGIAAEVLDESGAPAPAGAVGELAIRKPWIGMARGFWRDPDRYLAAYWSRWPGVWVHGDWARRDPDGQWHILGRSDDTLKVAGKRVGPAEVESILTADPRVMESAVIGVPDEMKGQAMIAFCVGVTPEVPDGLEAELLDKVGAALGRPLRPERAHFVSALPRTRNAKVMRRVLRAAYLGEDPGDVSALENPAALADIARARGNGGWTPVAVATEIAAGVAGTAAAAKETPAKAGAGTKTSKGAAMADAIRIKRVHHVEFWVGNAKQAEYFYRNAFGFARSAYAGLETGARDRAAYALRAGQAAFLVSSPYGDEGVSAAMGEHLKRHGDGVRDIALEVEDAGRAFDAALARGAEPAYAPMELKDGNGKAVCAGVKVYGDTIHSFISLEGYRGPFLPGFRSDPLPGRDAGLTALDHYVANVRLGEMAKWEEWYERVLGLKRFMTFDDKDISTEFTALNSVVMANASRSLKFPINEPAPGRKKSQVEEYNDFYRGPGVQHIALLTADILKTVSALRANGVGFLAVPDDYYEALPARVGPIQEAIPALKELGILVDRDDQGYLLQIFTRPLEDRPTLFFEIIQRKGCQGFGKGNFKALFEAIEREQERRGNLV